MEVKIIQDDNYQALYVNGKLRVSGHSLLPEEVVMALTGRTPDVITVDVDYEDDPDYTTDEDGNTFYKGQPVWINGKGYAEDFPFYEPAEEPPSAANNYGLKEGDDAYIYNPFPGPDHVPVVRRVWVEDGKVKVDCYHNQTIEQYLSWGWRLKKGKWQ